MLRVWLLGGFRLSVDSTTMDNDRWRLRKAASLVKLLALAPDHRLNREQAMDLLWPDLGRRAASNNLRQTLHTARKAFGAAGSRYLTSQDESLVLGPKGDLWVDAQAFEEAARAARRSQAPAAYRLALELYAGELPEDRYEPWAESRRADLRRVYLELLDDLAGLHEARGEYGPAIDALQSSAAEEPLNEEAHASLMRLYAVSGRQGEALAQYERLREIFSTQLDTEPGEATRRLREDIAAGRYPPIQSAAPQPGGPPPREPSGTGKHNLPAPLTSFVGRERDLVEVKRTLAMTRVLTLTGTGGSGKTRLALEVARDLIGAYPDGVWLVELAPLSEPGLVARAVAGALDVAERPGQPLAHTLADALWPRQTLLILDNCEHLVDAVARLVDELVRSCPNLRLLATSREALGVSGEFNRPVSPLSLPDPGRPPTVEELERHGAARLFVERALYRPSAFALTPENAGAVANICRRLEGIPLAIELAAARVGVLAVEQISERLSDSLKLLTGGGRTMQSRQQTLRGSLDWSHALLNEPERELFGRLSQFAGGWTLEAAEVVCIGGSIEQDEVLDLLGGLVDKSLVVAAGTGGASLYRMLEPIRQYAQERLKQGGEAEAVRRRHAAFFLALSEKAEPELAGPQQRLWVEQLDREHDNLRAALSWALESGEGELGLRFGRALWRFWHTRGYLGEGQRWLEEVLAASDPAPTPARIETLEGMGWMAQFEGGAERAEATYEEMLNLSRDLGDKGYIATALNSLGTLALARGDNERATVLLEENLAVLREMEDEPGTATTLKKHHAHNLLGALAINQEGDYARGAEQWEESLALAREAGDTYRVGTTLSNLGYVAVMQGDHERATGLGEEALTLAARTCPSETQPLPQSWQRFARQWYVDAELVGERDREARGPSPPAPARGRRRRARSRPARSAPWCRGA